MPKQKANKNLKDEIPAFVDIYATLDSCNTDPTQYKPYNPTLYISNSEQTVLVHLQVPSDEVEEVNIVKGERVIKVTASGMILMLRRLAGEMAAAVQGG